MALFHTELSRDGPGLLLRDILAAADPQVDAVARVVRAADPDVVVLADVDYDLGGAALAALALRIGGYPYRLALRPNRGTQSGRDLDGDGRLGGPGDAFGYGEFAGKGGLAILSRLPLGHAADFSAMPWTALPGHLAPDGTPPDQPLSTTAHWDVPVLVPGHSPLHLLVWHATPPVFDGPEDRNGRRNHDETAFWLRYLDGALGRPPPRDFVLAGVANLDPADGDGRPEALMALLADPRVRDPAPASEGGRRAADPGQGGDPGFDTADFPDDPGWPGNLRVDYVLPSASLGVAGTGVLWPGPETPLGRDVARASRHRLVWVDIEPGGEGQEGGFPDGATALPAAGRPPA